MKEISITRFIAPGDCFRWVVLIYLLYSVYDQSSWQLFVLLALIAFSFETLNIVIKITISTLKDIEKILRHLVK